MLGERKQMACRSIGWRSIASWRCSSGVGTTRGFVKPCVHSVFLREWQTEAEALPP